MKQNQKRPPGMFKVAFDLPQVNATWPPFDAERIWAKKTAVPYRLEIRNIPFFVQGLPLGDLIRAKPDQGRRELVFDGLVRHSGHSTVRVILRDKKSETRDRVLGLVQESGCGWEFANVDFHLP
ncbi:DUF4265 domain-containing protein [Micromonospora sp. NPDC000207]|uniref:DUF4265 domain-containing protein n=1 Tax=Micromonospora sp. NPDC000207 TaxID=3154246 RepID=UPI003329867D